MPLPARLLDRQDSLLEPERLPSLPPTANHQLSISLLHRLRESFAGTAAAGVTNATELLHALDRVQRTGILPTTLDPFDVLLGGGLPRGRMVELTGRRGAGRFSIAIAAIAAATSMGEAAALIDLGDHLDPQLAEADGVDLRRMLWVRPRTLKHAVMSVEMIAAAGFQLVILDAGLHPIRGRRVPDASWVRLARAAEAHGTTILISTPYPITGTASEAVIVAERSRMIWAGRGRSPRLLIGAGVDLRLEKHRHRKAGAHATLSLLTASELSAGSWQLAAVSRGTASSQLEARSDDPPRHPAVAASCQLRAES